jgi:rRNA processing protein Gar1
VHSLGKLEHKKGNKLVFKNITPTIPPIGATVSKVKLNQDKEKLKQKKVRIGKIIDVFGPVKQPWILAKLNKESTEISTSYEYIWEKKSFVKKKEYKKSHYRKNKPYTKKRKKKNR